MELTERDAIEALTAVDLELTVPPSATIAPRGVFESHSLPLIPLADDGTGFAVRQSIGSGGMGRVLLATQTALGRDVAIKTVFPDAPDWVSAALLQEARTMGTLEHPNIVPIYAIGRDHSDRAVIVMKRVEGETWRDLLGGADLERNIEILLAVCDALAFAHDRGILHRDLKPDNVMIGPFGEVYLMDWGIAVARSGVRHVAIPSIEESPEIAGTPAYMAPEMTVAGAAIDVTTDVFLLGAVLHEILTGSPPNRSETVVRAIIEASRCEPAVYAKDVPQELAATCSRAMRRAPDERHPDVASFANELRSFQNHRSSRVITAKSHVAVDALHESIATGSTDDETLQRHFGAARFGFEQALEVWPENQSAREGIRSAIELMIEYELRRENAPAVKSLLRELVAPPDNLERRLRMLERKQASEKAELATLRREVGEMDVTRNLGKKRLVASINGALLFAILGSFALLDATGVVPYDRAVHLVATGAIAVAGAAIFVFARGRMERIRAEIRTIGAIASTVTAVLLVRFASLYAGMTPEFSLVAESFTLGTGFMVLGITLDPRFRYGGLFAWVMGFLMTVIPESALYIEPFAVGGTFWVIALAPLDERQFRFGGSR